MYEPASVTAAVPLDNFCARVTFSDGVEREINLWPYINHGGVFDPIRSNPAYFQLLAVENDTITWPNGADIDPDVLYLDLPPNAAQAEWEAARDAAPAMR